MAVFRSESGRSIRRYIRSPSRPTGVIVQAVWGLFEKSLAPAPSFLILPYCQIHLQLFLPSFRMKKPTASRWLPFRFVLESVFRTVPKYAPKLTGLVTGGRGGGERLSSGGRRWEKEKRRKQTSSLATKVCS